MAPKLKLTLLWKRLDQNWFGKVAEALLSEGQAKLVSGQLVNDKLAGIQMFTSNPSCFQTNGGIVWRWMELWAVVLGYFRRERWMAAIEFFLAIQGSSPIGKWGLKGG